MSLSCRGYFSSQQGADGAAALKRLWAIDAALKQLAAHKPMNWSGRVLLSPADVEDGALPADAVLRAATGRWPAIALNVTFATGTVQAADLAAIEGEFQLELLGEFSQGPP